MPLELEELLELDDELELELLELEELELDELLELEELDELPELLSPPQPASRLLKRPMPIKHERAENPIFVRTFI